ncbi:MAG: hypothetical protein ABI557_16710, partial [Aureliella sp.]
SHSGMGSLMGVAFASTVEKSELMIIEFKDRTSEFSCKFGGTRPVFRIGHFVDPARIVNDSKKGDNFNVGSSLLSQSLAVFKNSCPVRNAMVTVQWQSVVF